MAAPRSSEVDRYIADAEPFARPILEHIRSLVHAAAPGVTEALKWRMPFFLLNGKPLCHLAAFSRHCGFGFWGEPMRAYLAAEGVGSDEGMGSFGRITSLKDLPSDAKLRAYIRHAIELRAAPSAKPKRAAAATRPPLVIPPVLKNALAANRAARDAFNDMSYTHRKEYAEWIQEAKRESTRETRLAKALTLLRQGKSLNSAYERRR